MAAAQYVLITAARNEEDFIEYPLGSVVSQSIAPDRWIILSDGSTDNTDSIIKKYAAQYRFIQYVRVERGNHSGGFAAKVSAFNHGLQLLGDTPYDFVGNLDADVSFEGNYYECMLHEFQQDASLGIAGGYIYERQRGDFRPRPQNDTGYVSGAVQLFRRECFRDIDGYTPIPSGGEDTVAVIKARMNGWSVKALPHVKVCHHKVSSKKRGACRERWRDGSMDYALGSRPLFQILKSVSRLGQKPYGLSALIRLAGFFWQYCCREKRLVNEEFVKYLRAEQDTKMKSILRLNGRT